MIKNYFKIAWRNLLKHKAFSLINILGLSIGLAACTLIFLYVYSELTYDHYHTKAERIARVSMIVHPPNSSEQDLVLATAPIPLAEILKTEYTEIESAVRLEPSRQVVSYNNNAYREEAFYNSEQSVFSVFDFQFVQGSAAGALINPFSIVITETIAKKYFGRNDVLGKTLKCNNEDRIITGVVKNRPANSDIRIDALLSTKFPTIAEGLGDWSAFTFVLFHTKPVLKSFKEKLSFLSPKYFEPLLKAEGAIGYSVKFETEALIDVHFSEGKQNDTPKGNKQFNYIFSLLAFSILVIALLNYINLTTAKSSERAKEVGIRKVSGAVRSQLIRQFLSESFLTVTIACILAIAIIQIGRSFFNNLLQTQLSFNGWSGFVFMGIIFLITFLLAGLYPAFVLSGFKPSSVLKGNWKHGSKGVVLRKSITVFQFAVAAVLIVGTTVIYKQIKFISEKDLGFNEEQLVAVYLPADSVSQMSVKAFQNTLRQRPEVKGMTIGFNMTEEGRSLSTVIAQTDEKKQKEFVCNYFPVDPQFLSVFQIQLVEGRNFSDNFSTDKNEGYLVNEAFVRTMGWKSAVGKQIELGNKGIVIGVVKDFCYKSFHNIIEPAVLTYNNNSNSFFNTATIKADPEFIPVLSSLYKSHFPSLPFEYSFYDELVEKRYEKDRRTMSLFNYFTVFAIIIASLGLYGLVALLTVQRTKEIGIRKVLGASIQQLFSLQAGDFVKLVFPALVIALPVAGFVMSKWLTSYAYHITVSWWIFLMPVVLLLMIVLLVISVEIIKAASANPVKSLRTE